VAQQESPDKSGPASVTVSATVAVSGTKAHAATLSLPLVTGLALSSQKGAVGAVSVSTALLVTADGTKTYYMKRYPSVILSSANLAGAYSDIDEDPNNPDGSWLLFAA
jgi:hypothetical protein